MLSGKNKKSHPTALSLLRGRPGSPAPEGPAGPSDSMVLAEGRQPAGISVPRPGTSPATVSPGHGRSFLLPSRQSFPRAHGRLPSHRDLSPLLVWSLCLTASRWPRRLVLGCRPSCCPYTMTHTGVLVQPQDPHGCVQILFPECEFKHLGRMWGLVDRVSAGLSAGSRDQLRRSGQPGCSGHHSHPLRPPQGMRLGRWAIGWCLPDSLSTQTQTLNRRTEPRAASGVWSW